MESKHACPVYEQDVALPLDPNLPRQGWHSEHGLRYGLLSSISKQGMRRLFAGEVVITMSTTYCFLRGKNMLYTPIS